MTLNDPWKERQGSIASSVLDDVDKSIVLCYGEIRNLKIIDTGRWWHDRALFTPFPIRVPLPAMPLFFSTSSIVSINPFSLGNNGVYPLVTENVLQNWGQRV